MTQDVNDNDILIPEPDLFSPIGHGTETFGAHALDGTPELASLIARVIATFSDVDSIYENMIAALLPKEASKLNVILRNISDGNKKRGVVRTLLKSALRDRDRSTFTKADDAITRVRKIRNNFAHGIWGASSRIHASKCLLLLPSSDYSQFSGATAEGSEVLKLLSPVMKVLNECALGDASSGKTHVPTNLQLRAAQTASALQEHVDRAMRPLSLGPTQTETLYKNIEVWHQSNLQVSVTAAAASFNTAVGVLICIKRDETETERLRQAIARHGLLPKVPLAYLDT